MEPLTALLDSANFAALFCSHDGEAFRSPIVA
jgi:hypothetical protein